ncbi:MAG: DUF3316 domain-containing protein [Muribaculaceae bacterium]|nr:DUF3316 domain-containing protein [Muribaculaceae bacterium]MDE5976705.1 DUF3316 domain-containing protein [Muribaculaceae bacterium]MDE6299418.1 DUF3316 domain-containing protein [Muribaculaceae bacterium]
MRIINTLLLTAVIVFLSVFTSRAENNDSVISRPVTGIYSLEIGRINVLATYLSPLHYIGPRMGIAGEWSKALPFNPERMTMHFNGGAGVATLLNPAHTARMLGADLNFRWGMSWRTSLPYGITMTLGGTVDLDGSVFYLMRNSNNPVEVMASVGLGLRGALARPFMIGRLPVLVRDVVSLPSLSVFFSPEYGETYYEIYLGNRKGLVHAGWWGNKFRIDNLLSFSLDFGRTALTLGYRFNADTQWANNLNTKVFTHSFVIGVIPGGLGLKHKKPTTPSETIYSLY